MNHRHLVSISFLPKLWIFSSFVEYLIEIRDWLSIEARIKKVCLNTIMPSGYWFKLCQVKRCHFYKVVYRQLKTTVSQIRYSIEYVFKLYTFHLKRGLIQSYSEILVLCSQFSIYPVWIQIIREDKKRPIQVSLLIYSPVSEWL